jgi:DNA polymerase elongation subunit (family B)
MFRLFDFNILSNFNRDGSVDTDEEEGSEEFQFTTRKNEETFTIQMFGLNESGDKCCIFVDDYKPFFYVLVGDDWKKETKDHFVSHIKKKLGKYNEDCLVASYLIKRRKLYGFDNGKLHKFVRLDFSNMTAFNKAKKLWYFEPPIDSGRKREPKLNRNGYIFNGFSTRLYEANIPPLLRFFHIKMISPSGWVQVCSSQVSRENRFTTCQFEYHITQLELVPLPDKETAVPYKICSFDIESGSSHGDFPVPVKSYKKLANNIIEYFERYPEFRNKDDGNAVLTDLILSAFEYHEPIHEISTVYPIVKPSQSKIINLIGKFLDTMPYEKSKSKDDCLTIEKMFEKTYAYVDADGVEEYAQDDDPSEDLVQDDMELTDIDDDSSEDDEPSPILDELSEISVINDEDGTELIANSSSTNQSSSDDVSQKKPSQTKPRQSTYNIMNIICDKRYKRETIVDKVTEHLGRYFPKLEGDPVTFIGSTFLTYGTQEPYLNHCISLNSCSQVRDAVIESYGTEREVLLAWTRLIQREDPDIIIGYNIFGFDYEFMYRRARENCCVEDFLKLSRNIGEVCGKQSKDDPTDYQIEVTSMKQFDIKFIKIAGRMQIDVYNYFRREESMISYKLDYVAGQFIGDAIKKISIGQVIANTTEIYTKNLTGLKPDNFIHIEEIGHSTEYYDGGRKYRVVEIYPEQKMFIISGTNITPDMENKKVRWCLAKDDVTPQDIFRLTKGTDEDRAIVAKYCIADCNLVHYLTTKADILTGFIEMSSICSVPINFLVMRGQGIKLTSYISKKCREKNTLMPVIDNGDKYDAYEGAIVLVPKCNLYLDNPVACVDFASLYPSSIISENLSHDTKVWTKTYDLDGNLISEFGEKDSSGNFIYDNIPGYNYVNITYDMYRYVKKQSRNGVDNLRFQKVLSGSRVCRYVQPNEIIGKGIMPSILEELLGARKATRKLIPQQTDDFMKNVLDKRQLGYKVTANSLYGQCGAKTSTFYEQDIAASTTATGRLLITYARTIIEECYGGGVVINTEKYGPVQTHAEYIYGDTDSVFFTFNLRDMNGDKIVGYKALDLTIEIAQKAGHLASSYLKQPHDLEYEKTFMPFCLLSKKRYVGMLYETDPNSGKRKEMGIVLKRRDNAPIVKDVYGGIIDILMKQQNVEQAIRFLQDSLQEIVEEKIPMEKLIISKSLRGYYKNPQGIAHKVLADRISIREPGNKPGSGDRIPYVYIVTKGKVKQGDKIETPMFILNNHLKIDYTFYITNQIMKPVSQVFALILPEVCKFLKKPTPILKKYEDNPKKNEEMRCAEIEKLIFEPFLRQSENKKKNLQPITNFFTRVKK